MKMKKKSGQRPPENTRLPQSFPNLKIPKNGEGDSINFL
jgi:hypothetical protein